MAIKLYVGDLDAVGLSNKYMLIILHKISVSKLSKVVIAIETCQVYLLPTYLSVFVNGRLSVINTRMFDLQSSQYLSTQRYRKSSPENEDRLYSS